VLRARGARVDRVVAYRTVDAPADALAEFAAAARAGALDAVLVASPSAAGALVRALGGGPAALAGVRLVCIGPTTADACRALGAPVAAVALEPTDAALVEAVVQVVHSA
jgi:uroporphyrinogen-III synthase